MRSVRPAPPIRSVKSRRPSFSDPCLGKAGRHPHIDRELVTVPDEESVVTALEEIVDWVYHRVWSGRLLSNQMNDLQFETFRDDIKRAFRTNPSDVVF
jgi:hypothetical protein